MLVAETTQPVQENRLRGDSFQPAEGSERPASRRAGWLGVAAQGSIPAFALSHSQKVNKKLLLFLKRLFLPVDVDL